MDAGTRCPAQTLNTDDVMTPMPHNEGYAHGNDVVCRRGGPARRKLASAPWLKGNHPVGHVRGTAGDGATSATAAYGAAV